MRFWLLVICKKFGTLGPANNVVEFSARAHERFYSGSLLQISLHERDQQPAVAKL